MHITIHAGMHKTGSTSIQHTFHKFQNDQIRYLDWHTPNHSALFMLLSRKDPENYHLFSKVGRNKADLITLRRVWEKKLDTELARDKRHLVISGEDISMAPKSAVQSFRDYLSKASKTIDVLMYIRPPTSFIVSAFQQRLKGGGIRSLELGGLWPKYRYRVEKLDTIFGRQNVTLRPFHPWDFPNGNVVLDFAAQIGVSLAPEQIKRQNDSISAEATALLYLQRSLGDGFGARGPGMPRRNKSWFEKLNKLGSLKFRFSQSLMEPILEKNRDDLEWIEARLGQVLEEPDRSDAYEISSEADLIDLAMSKKDEVIDMLAENISLTKGTVSPSRLVYLLEVLRELSDDKINKPKST